MSQPWERRWTSRGEQMAPKLILFTSCSHPVHWSVGILGAGKITDSANSLENGLLHLHCWRSEETTLPAYGHFSPSASSHGHGLACVWRMHIKWNVVHPVSKAKGRAMADLLPASWTVWKRAVKMVKTTTDMLRHPLCAATWPRPWARHYIYSTLSTA